MRRLIQIFNYIRCHKYKMTLLIFVLIIGVLDENSMIQRFSHKREISALNEEISRYRKQYEEDSRMLKEITNNKEALEKVAREKYLMKQANEDIFVFEEDIK